MKLSINGLIGLLLAGANVAVAFLLYPANSAGLEILVMVVYVIAFIFVARAYENNPISSTLKKWVIIFFGTAVVNVIRFY